MAGTGQKWSLAAASRNVRFPIRKPTFESTAAAHKDLFVGYFSFEISKRKKSPVSDFVA
jgi:hypothetical protein